MTATSFGTRDWLGRVAFGLSILVLVTSMMDLLINRLLFRAGPEMFTHIQFPGIASVAVIGTISLTFEQMILYVILGSIAVILVRQGETIPRYLGLLLLPQLACAALLYLPVPLAGAWALSMVLVLVTAIEVFGVIILRAKSGQETRRNLAIKLVFLVMLGLSFFFPIYYRVSVLLGSIGVASVPFGIEAYTAGVYAIMGASIGAFAYSLVAPASNFRMNIVNLIKVAVVPSLLVFPFLYGLMESFFMTQIFALVIAMSADITLSFNLVRAIVLASWFLLIAVSFLLWKGRASRDWFFAQQGIGLILVLSTTFLFNYPNYLLLGTTGVLLICYPLVGSARQTANDLTS